MKKKPIKQRVWVNYKCRCKHCKHRKTLPRRPNEYIRPPKCECCFHNEWVIDWNRMLKPNNSRGGEVCKEDCYHFPHRTNSNKCRHYEEYILKRSFNPKSNHLPEPKLEDWQQPF